MQRWNRAQVRHGDITGASVMCDRHTVTSASRGNTRSRNEKGIGAQSIEPKFPGWGSKISLCRMDRDRSERSRSICIPLAKRVSLSFRTKDVASLLLVLKLDDDFDGDISDIVWAASSIVI